MTLSDFQETVSAGEATRLRELYGLTEVKAIDLRDLALAMNIVVIEDRLDGADAWLLRKGNKGLIRVKKDIPEAGRKRFAVGHEIGHWILHEKISQFLACTSDDLSETYRNSDPELEASRFSSELLMPTSLFSTAMSGTRPTADTIKELANQFQTTLTATAVRYVDLSLDYCALAVSMRGKLRWWRASSAFGSELWLQAGSALSPRTVASTFFSGGRLPSGPVEVDAAAWAERAPHHADFFYEDVLALPTYESTLSLLWLD